MPITLNKKCVWSFLFQNFLISLLLAASAQDAVVDLTLVAPTMSDEAGGLKGIAYTIIETLYHDITIQYISTQNRIQIENMLIPDYMKQVLKNNQGAPGKVALFTEILRSSWNIHALDALPASKIKYAYSMIESSRIPKKWVQILNTQFDAVIVPDPWLVEVYERSGVTVPIFVLPCILELEKFFENPAKLLKPEPFVFGTVASGFYHKNYAKLIEAFNKEFGNNPNVILALHAQTGNKEFFSEIFSRLEIIDIPQNIHLNLKWLPRDDYIKFISSLSCFVSVSMGEGFSICPREALAAGIPCILSNNTAHKIICENGFAEPVESNRARQAVYPHLQSEECGYQMDCEVNRLRRALRNVYENYDHYISKTKKARAWVRQYCSSQLKEKYLNVIKPKKIIYGNRNIITDTFLMTNSKNLVLKHLNSRASQAYG